MKRVFEVVLVVLVFFFSCSEPLDARKVESHKIVLDFDSGEPVEVMAPKGAVESPGAEPEDMLGVLAGAHYRPPVRGMTTEPQARLRNNPNGLLAESKEDPILLQSGRDTEARWIKRARDGRRFWRKPPSCRQRLPCPCGSAPRFSTAFRRSSDEGSAQTRR